ncbi:MAG: DUF4249 domain-containing protein [Ginsengibacter sp.]
MKTILLILACVLIASCEKNIEFNLKEVPDLLVVDASIENGRSPMVILSKSVDYYSKITPELIENAFVHDAEVFLSDNNRTQKLKEYSTNSAGGIQFFYYSVDTSNLGNAFIGKLSTGYELKVLSGGKEYRSQTTIPALSKKIDSLWWKPAPFTTDSSKVVVFVRATDPLGLGNYIRYFMRQNSGAFLPGSNSVFDDQLIDGTTYDLRLDPGLDRNDPVPFDDNFFHRGDTVTLKLSNIDRTSYTFWLTMEFAYQSIGNPFASPNKVLGNISNGALGAFCGYASVYKTLVIPK